MGRKVRFIFDVEYDPIQDAIDIQLSGLMNDLRPSNPEDLIIRAIDRKYHYYSLREEFVIFKYQEGYTQGEIGMMMGVTKMRISQILLNKTKI